MSVESPRHSFGNIDTLFARNREETDFCFDKNVVDVFDDMLDRSVPFYPAVQTAIAQLAVDLATDGRRIYDIGCSLGTLALTIASGLQSNSHIVGIDSSPEMIAAARQRAQHLRAGDRISYELGDATLYRHFEDACVAIFSLTLQFIRPPKRLPLLQRVCESLNDGGSIIVFEKVVFEDRDINRRFINKYYDFKRSNGYSDIEIAQKRTSLENILIPYTLEENIEMLKGAGFSSVNTFFQWYNFAAFLALK